MLVIGEEEDSEVVEIPLGDIPKAEAKAEEGQRVAKTPSVTIAEAKDTLEINVHRKNAARPTRPRRRNLPRSRRRRRSWMETGEIGQRTTK